METNINKREKLLLEEITEKAKTQFQKYAKPRIISSAIEGIISMLCIIGIQWVEMQFQADAFTKPNFWIRMGISTIGIFFLFRAVVNCRFERSAQRELVVNARNEYNSLNTSKKLDFKVFLKQFNLKTKVANYTQRIYRQLSKLEGKLLKAIKPKRIEKIQKRIDILNEKISDEYIMAHIDLLRVKYYVVYETDFFIESSAVNNGNVITRAEYNKAFNKASFNKIWLYVIISAIFAMGFVSDEPMNVVQMITNFLGSAFMVSVRVASAIVETDVIYDKTITTSIMNKAMILKEYYQWQTEQPIATPTEREKLAQDIRKEVEAKANEKLAQIKQEFENRLNTNVV